LPRFPEGYQPFIGDTVLGGAFPTAAEVLVPLILVDRKVAREDAGPPEAEK